MNSAPPEQSEEKGSLIGMSSGTDGNSSYHIELHRKENEEENRNYQTKADVERVKGQSNWPGSLVSVQL